MNFFPNEYRTIFLSLFLLVSSSGCVLVPVVAGGVIGGSAAAYLKGVLKTKEPASFDRIWFAVLEVVEQQELEVIKKESNTGKALVEAKLREQDKPVYITVKYHKPEITNLAIRVGIWGNEDESRRILKLIHEKLY